jgi:hypothetical protein
MSMRSSKATLLIAAVVAVLLAIAWFGFGAHQFAPPPKSLRSAHPPVESPAADGGAQPTAQAPAPAPAEPSAFAGVDVQLSRVGGAEPERLSSPALTRIGDRLRIGISTDRELYVYAFNQEQHGAVTVMFPLGVLDKRNPLAGGEHELPGTAQGQWQSYTVASRAPSEEILLVLALARLKAMEDRVASLAGVASGDAAPAAAAGDYDALDTIAHAAQAAGPDQVAVHRWRLDHAPVAP